MGTLQVRWRGLLRLVGQTLGAAVLFVSVQMLMTIGVTTPPPAAADTSQTAVWTPVSGQWSASEGCGWETASAPPANAVSAVLTLSGAGGGGSQYVNGEQPTGGDGGELTTALTPSAVGTLTVDLGCGGGDASALSQYCWAAGAGGSGWSDGGDGGGQTVASSQADCIPSPSNSGQYQSAGGGGGSSALCIGDMNSCSSSDPSVVAVAAGGGGSGSENDCAGTSDSGGTGGTGGGWGGTDDTSTGTIAESDGQGGYDGDGSDGQGGSGATASGGGGGGSGYESQSGSSGSFTSSDPWASGTGAGGGGFDGYPNDSTNEVTDEHFATDGGGGGGGFAGGGGGGGDGCTLAGENDAAGGGGGGSSAVNPADAVDPDYFSPGGWSSGPSGGAVDSSNNPSSESCGEGLSVDSGCPGTVSLTWDISAPQISSIEPDTGSVTGNTTLTIDGSHLTGASVTVGGQAAALVSETADQIVVTTPPGTDGEADVVVTNNGGPTDDSGAFFYVYPTISPTVGATVGGTTVDIGGTGLSGASVTVGGQAASVVSDTDTELVVTTPPGSFGAADVVITTPAGSFDVPSAFFYDAPIHFTTSSLPPAVVGTPYSVTVGAAGTSAVDVVTLDPASPPVPDGLSLSTDFTTGQATLSGTPTATGTTDLVFDATDQEYGYTVTADMALTVDSLSATASPQSSTYGDKVDYSAALSTGGGSPGDSVTFSADDTTLCSALLEDGTASCDSTTTPAGANETVSASYPGDGTFAATTATTTVSVAQASSTVSAQATPETTMLGSNVLYSADVTSAGGTPTGAVAFSLGDTALCSATLSDGAGSCTSNQAPLGADQSVSAQYGGDTNFSASSGTATLNVTQIAQTVVFTTTPVDPVVGGTYTPAATGGASGNPVVITVDPATASACTETSGGTVLFERAGSCVLDANQAGDTDYLAAPQAQQSITVRANPLSWATPAKVTYGTRLSSVQLDAHATIAGTFAYSPGAGTVLGVGQHLLDVTFTPRAAGASRLTDTVLLSVVKATPTLRWPSPVAVPYGTALSGTQLDASSAVPGTFTYSVLSGTVLAAGAHNLSVTFSPTDTADYNAVTLARTLMVRKAATHLTLFLNTPMTYGSEQSSPFLVQVSTSSLLASTTGKVTVLLGSVTLCTLTLTSSTGECSVASGTRLPVGTYHLTARYAGSTNLEPSVATTSEPAELVVTS